MANLLIFLKFIALVNFCTKSMEIADFNLRQYEPDLFDLSVSSGKKQGTTTIITMRKILILTT